MKLTQEECIENFKIYTRVTEDKSGGIMTEYLEGIPGDKKNYIHESTSEYGDFDNKAIKIPKGYKLNKSKKIGDPEWVKEYVCKLRKNKTQKVVKKKETEKLKGGLIFNDWYNKSKKYWLTINDIIKLKPNDKIVLLSLHRNVLDIPYDTLKDNKLYKPEVFFKDSKDTYVHKKDLVGDLKFDRGMEKDITFDVEYKKGSWYPFSNGYLPAKDSQGRFKLLGKKTHWTKFNKKTHIGFRGPIMLWSDLKKMPKIYKVNDSVSIH